jgi:ribosomal protein S14
VKPADLFLRDSCAQCGEPNAHYVDDGCTGQQDHVITDDGPPLCRPCVRQGVAESHHRYLDDAIKRTMRMPWEP